MVTIRFARFGPKKKPFYHMVVTHSENPRDGRYIEQLGTYDPSKEVKDAKIDLDRVDHWVTLGAKPSTRALHVLNDYRRITATAAA